MLRISLKIVFFSTSFTRCLLFVLIRMYYFEIQKTNEYSPIRNSRWEKHPIPQLHSFFVFFVSLAINNGILMDICAQHRRNISFNYAPYFGVALTHNVSCYHAIIVKYPAFFDDDIITKHAVVTVCCAGFYRSVHSTTQFPSTFLLFIVLYPHNARQQKLHQGFFLLFFLLDSLIKQFYFLICFFQN